MQDLEALDWMLGTARALHYLHTQLPLGAVVHRVGAAGGAGGAATREQGTGEGSLHYLHTQLPLGAVVHRVGGWGGRVQVRRGREGGGGGGRCIICMPSCPLGPSCTEWVAGG